MSNQATTVTTAATTAATTPATTTLATTPAAAPKGFMDRMKSGTDSTATTTTTTTATTAGTTTETTTAASTEATTTGATTKKQRKVAQAYKDAPGLNKEDVKQIVQAAVEGAVSATTAKAKQDVEDDANLSDEEKADLSVMAAMEELNPKYKGLSTRAKTYLKELGEEERRFKSEHPDDEFDTDGKVAARLARQHKVDYSDRDYRNAEIHLGSAPVREENDRLRKQVEEVSQREFAKQVISTAVGVGGEVAHEFDKSYAEIIESNGALNKKKAEELLKKDPIKAPIILDAITQAQSFSAGVVQFFKKKKVENDTDQAVSRFMINAEKRFSAADETVQTDSRGRRFATYAEFSKLPESERANRWTLNEAVVIELAKREITDGAKAYMEQEVLKTEEKAKALGYTKTDTVTTTATTGGTTTAATTRNKVDTVDSSAGPQGAGGAGGASDEGYFASRMKRGTSSQ